MNKDQDRLRASPIFVVGCGHSGTSILARIIGAHSRVFAIPGETGIASTGNVSQFQNGMRKFDAKALESDCSRWVEKTPSHVRHLSFLFTHAPEALVVGILRDPRDVCFSLKKRNGDLQRSINRWALDNTAMLPFFSHPRFFMVRYEMLVESPRSTTEDIMNFLGESFEEGQLQFHEQKVNWYANTDEKPDSDLGEANHNQNRNWQINQPLFDGRGKWRGQLDPEELTKIKSALGPLAKTVGYCLD